MLKMRTRTHRNTLAFLLCWIGHLRFAAGSNRYDTATGNCALDAYGELNGTNDGSCFRCLDRTQGIPVNKLCDGVLDCQDLSDECLCENLNVPKSICALYDPNFDPSNGCQNEQDGLTCVQDRCMNKKSICGGLDNCSVANDVKICSSWTSEMTSISCASTRPGGEVQTINAVMCDGVLECDGREDECSDRCAQTGSPTLPSFCVPELSCLPGPLICDGVWDSPNTKSCNETKFTEEEESCFERFYCNNNGRISISQSKVCDGVVDCDDGSDEDTKQNCTDKRFYCHNVFNASDQNSTTVTNSFVFKHQVFDGRRDCDDGSDECYTPEWTFSSKSEMFSAVPLRWILWISAVKALIGNVAVVGLTVYILTFKQKELHKTARCHHMLLLQLSTADLMMSVYLLAIAIKSVNFSGRYCEKDLSWRSSDACTALGIVTFTSSEVSAGIMAIMAIFRFATIYRPIKTFYSSKTEKLVKLFIILAWVVSILVAVLPVLPPIQHHFTTHAVTRCSLYDSNVVDIKTMKLTALRALTSLKRSDNTAFFSGLTDPRTLNDLQIIHDMICPQETIKWIGFYNQNGACLPRLFATTSEPAWQYSLVFLLFNCCVFVIIAICYILIVRRTLQSAKKVGSTCTVPQCELQTRVTRLLITDFLCWIPVCIIGFIYVTGFPISPTVYAVCGIVLIPINSALNPALYSGLCEYCGKMVKKLRSTPSSTETTDDTPRNKTEITSERGSV